jgi:hypothetical protein
MTHPHPIASTRRIAPPKGPHAKSAVRPGGQPMPAPAEVSDGVETILADATSRVVADAQRTRVWLLGLRDRGHGAAANDALVASAAPGPGAAIASLERAGAAVRRRFEGPTFDDPKDSRAWVESVAERLEASRDRSWDVAVVMATRAPLDAGRDGFLAVEADLAGAECVAMVRRRIPLPAKVAGGAPPPSWSARALVPSAVAGAAIAVVALIAAFALGISDFTIQGLAPRHPPPTPDVPPAAPSTSATVPRPAPSTSATVPRPAPSTSAATPQVAPSPPPAPRVVADPASASKSRRHTPSRGPSKAQKRPAPKSDAHDFGY